MRINAGVLVVVGMMVGSAFATGCKAQNKITDTGNQVAASEATNLTTPEDNPAAAPVSEDAVQAQASVEKDWYGYRYWAYRAPPAYRYEPVGAYRPGYFWRPGYYGWSGRDYVWYGGAYYPERVGYRYVSPAWYSVGPRWGYRSGHWVHR
jgi:hypothetical protein